MAHAAPVRFVIISTPRCGTHMLRTALDGHPQIRCLAEAFNPDLTSKAPYAPDTPTVEILERHVFGDAGDARAVGFAIHRSGAPLGQWTDIWTHLLARTDVRVVLLHRFDLLARWLSHRLMRARNRSGNRDLVPPLATVTADVLRTEFLRYERELVDFKTRFAGHRCDQVSYEDLVHRFDGTIQRLQQFLGVTPSTVAPRTHRNAAVTPDELIANYEELVEAFADSRWSHCFPRSGALSGGGRGTLEF